MHPIYFIQALAAKAFLSVFRLAGVRGGSWMGSMLGRFLGTILRERHIAADNVRQALPHLSNAEQKAVLRECWSRIGRVIGEFPNLDKIAAEADTRISIIGAENVHKACPDGGPAIFVSGHISNWELLMLGIQRVGVQAGALYRRANNPYMEPWIVKQRGAFASAQVQKGSNGARAMIELLKGGTSLAILVDQKLGRGDPVTFFGRPTKAPSAAIKLARRLDIPVIPTVIRRRMGGSDKVHFEHEFFPALQIAQTDNLKADVDAAMREVYDYLEEWIGARPEEWFWQHNRWK